MICTSSLKTLFLNSTIRFSWSIMDTSKFKRNLRMVFFFSTSLAHFVILSSGPSSQNPVEVIVFQDLRKKQKTTEPPAPPVLSVSLLRWTLWSFFSPFCLNFSHSSLFWWWALLAAFVIMWWICVQMLWFSYVTSSRPSRNQRRHKVTSWRNSTWKRWQIIIISCLSQI